MPYKNNSDLPDNVKSVLPSKAQTIFRKAFNSAYDKYGEKRARRIAWSAVKKSYKKVKDKWVHKTKNKENYTTVRYTLQKDNIRISKTKDGKSQLEVILTDNQIDKHKMKWSDQALKGFVNQINSEGLKGYYPIEQEHEVLKKAFNDSMTPDEMEDYIKDLNTGIKAISAKYDNGSLLSTVEVDNDLVPMIKDKKISVEARVPDFSIKGDTYEQGRLTSFIFADDVANDNTGVVA